MNFGGHFRPFGFQNVQTSYIVFDALNSNPNKILSEIPQNYNQTKENTIHTISLLQKLNDFDIFHRMPKTFTITTNTSSCDFNIEMLKETSSIISTFLAENPHHLQYHINIEDDLNVLTKIKQLYEGKTVLFDEDQIFLTQKIAKSLQLTCFPNFLKPPSLRINGNFNFQLSPGQSTSSMINISQFNKYLQNAAPKTFSIKTNKQEYQCNVFGILSSTILSDIITKDNTITSYSYDIEDEFDEFQPICDFFNFQNVSLSKDNVDAIKEIAEDLQITCILENINSYIDYIENVSKKIDEQQIIIDAVDDLFDLLYNIKEQTVETVKTKIFESKWSKTNDNVHELAAFILQVIKTDFILHPYLFDLLIQIDKDSNENDELKNLLPFIISILIYSTFGSIQDSNQPTSYNVDMNKIPFNNDMAKYAFIFKLYKNGMISKEKIKSYITKYNFSCIELNLWFLPELVEIHGLEAIQKHFQKIPKTFGRFTINIDDQKEKDYKSFVSSYLPDKIELYKEMRDKEEPTDLLTKALRNDDIDTLQSIISKSPMDLSKSFVPFNLFENYINNGNTKYINYAAAYGSLKCFKYLLLNHFEIDDYTFACAVFGGNIEIIKIAQQNTDSIIIEPPYKNFNKTNNSNLYSDKIIPSIIKHRNDLFDWIFMQIITNLNSKSLVDYLNFAIENGNAHSIAELIEKANIPNIQTNLYNNCLCAAKNGFYLVTQLILKMMNDQSTSTIINPIWTVYFSNTSILNIFAKKMNQNYLESALIFAIKREYINIIKYFFDSIIHKISPTLALKILSICQNSNIQNYLYEKIKILNPDFFKDIYYLDQLLLQVCTNTNNIEMTNILTELIISIDSNFYFTSQLISSIMNGSTEICKYFIEKNVLIEYDKLFAHLYKTPNNIDEDLLIFVISTLNQENLELFNNYIDSAIQKKYKKLVDYLFSKGAFSDKALKLAVQSDDVDLVNIVLKYNNKPLFINKRFENGTALTIAVANNNIEIYKILISLEGIDPCLFGSQNINPLVQSIEKGNIEIFDSLIDLFGEKIKNQKWMLYEVLRKCVDSKTDKNDQTQKSRNNNNNNMPFEKIEHIINRVLLLKCIDINYHYSCHTLLTYACMNNGLNLVNNILKNDGIDVNSVESKKGDTPLIIAVRQNNFDIVDLLIKEPNINVNIQNFEQETALIIATTNKLHKIIDLIIHHKKFDPIESRANYSFILSDGEISNKFLSIKSLNVNCPLFSDDKEISFKTPLLISIYSNDLEKVKIITSHPSFNGTKSQISEAFKKALAEDKKEIVTELIKGAGKDINNINFENKSLLDLVIINSNDEAISEILKNPNFVLEPNVILNSFITSYTLISNKSPIKIMNYLYNYDKDHHNSIDFNNLLPNGKSFYTSLIDNNIYNGEICHFFLTHGVDPNKPDTNGVYPLEAAMNYKFSDAAIELINSGKIDFKTKFKIDNIDSEKPKYTTYIHMAAASSNHEIIELLLEKKIFDINDLNDVGDTPLIVACKMKRRENIIILFECDFVYNFQIDFHHKNIDGNDALKIVNSNENATDEKIDDKDDFLNTLLDHLSKF